jgi:hypothetical protein
MWFPGAGCPTGWKGIAREGPGSGLSTGPNWREATQNMTVQAAATASVEAQPFSRCGFCPVEGDANRAERFGHRLSPPVPKFATAGTCNTSRHDDNCLRCPRQPEHSPRCFCTSCMADPSRSLPIKSASFPLACLQFMTPPCHRSTSCHSTLCHHSTAPFPGVSSKVVETCCAPRPVAIESWLPCDSGWQRSPR